MSRTYCIFHAALRAAAVGLAAPSPGTNRPRRILGEAWGANRSLMGPDETTVEEVAMAAKTEHARSPAVVRVVELVGVSDKSWSDAAQQVVQRASGSLRHITGLDVLKSSAVVKDGKIVEYHVNVKIAFIVEPADIAR